MIVEFSVQNFRSIKDLQTISFLATGLKSSNKHSEVDHNNIAQDGGMNLFKTLGIYGANASGKSNIVKAFDFFLKAIAKEPSSQSHLNYLTDPFLYQKDSEATASYFQIVLIINNIKYRYGFTVKSSNNNDDENGSQEVITNEWLYGKKEKNMSVLFQRTSEKVKNKLSNKEKIPSSIPYKHTLFITHAAAFEKEGVCNLIRDYFRRLTTSNFNINLDKFRWLSIHYLEQDDKTKRLFLELLSAFNLDYSDVVLEKDHNFKKNEVFPQEKIFLTREFKTDANKTISVDLNLKRNESAGTQKLFDLAGLLLRAFNLPEPAFIILDEIDGNFHPALLIKLVGLFNNPILNKSNSQLLFTSHDTNLMSPSIMRRDQFYFTEKNEDQSTKLYSLADLKGIRNDADFAKQYLAGYYGALPVLKDFSNVTLITNE